MSVIFDQEEAGQAPAGAPKVAVIPTSLGLRPEAATAILEASPQVELFDEEHWAVVKRGFDPFVTPPVHDPQALVETARQQVQNQTLPVLLGGDQSIARYIPDFLSPPFTILHFSSSPNLLKEGAVRSLLDRDLAVVSVGVRELTAIEAQYIKKSPPGYNRFLAKENRQSWPTEVPQAIQTDAVVLVFDASVFDISVMPAVETPSPGGLSWAEATSLLKAVSSQKRVSTVLMTGLKPHPFLHAADFLMAKLLYKILGYCFVPR